ncbi:hypothetical protein B0H63DRAFT_302288 [Podospora didyma]|uniref:Uncharacterized protein n=1 Tax=Podospora didyma TaxID=330526 RepID=A0AAE0N7V2_9PEZI|nr:hypothetical protein B0H63DRAFT_302288 [Podospora didyma]
MMPTLLRALFFLLVLGWNIPCSLAAFVFLQTHDGYHTDSITEEQFLATPFNQLCTSGDCMSECSKANLTRIFQAVPENVTATVQNYGQPGKNGAVSVTLFGLCTNLVAANDLVQARGNSHVKSFFSSSHFQAVTDPFKKAALPIATCLSDTCGQTRDPSQCARVCNITYLLNNDTDMFDWRQAMLNCTQRLCMSPSVLPYANQDVLGIGVLLSYCIQGVLLLAAAAGVLASMSWKLWKRQDGNPGIIQKLEGPLDTFLTAETYFSISAAIASFILSPSTIDPLNGYALMAVAIVGFLCPVFTLLLLRSHDAHTRFGTSLTFISWLLNTVIFFILLRNLSAFGESVSEDALNQLFEVPTCGGVSSAMTLCQQLTGSNPLQRLTSFFEGSSWTNIHTVPMLWVWTTFALLLLIGEEVWQAVHLHRKKKAVGHQDAVDAAFGQSLKEQPEPDPFHAKYFRLGRFIAVLVLVGLFSLSLGYGFHMVMRFRKVGVIDTHGWSFGQVVAAMFWVPVFLDVAHSVFEKATPFERPFLAGGLGYKTNASDEPLNILSSSRISGT